MIRSAALGRKRKYYHPVDTWERWISEPIAGLPPGAIEAESMAGLPFGLSCVYFLVFCGDIVYVGATRCLKKRLPNHSPKVFHSVFYLPAAAADRFRIEREWIRKLVPKYNGQKRLMEMAWPFTSEEVREFRRAARRMGLTLNEWLRMEASKEARRVLVDAAAKRVLKRKG